MTSMPAHLYEQLRDQIIEEIRRGTYPRGSLLPSVRELVAQGVSTTTARRVLAELAGLGYAEARGTRGYVSAGPPPEDTVVPASELPESWRRALARGEKLMVTEDGEHIATVVPVS